MGKVLKIGCFEDVSFLLKMGIVQCHVGLHKVNVWVLLFVVKTEKPRVFESFAGKHSSTRGAVFFHCHAPRKSSLITNALWLHS